VPPQFRPIDDMLLPIWTPDKPSGSGDRFFAYSPKLRRFVSFSSKLERDYWLLLEFDPTVTAFCEQPAMVHVVIDGCWRKSRLDFWVSRRPGIETFVEIKYASELRDVKSRAHRQIETQQKGLRAAGRNHEVVTDETICANPILLNSLRTLLGEFDSNYPRLIEQAKPLMEWISFLVARGPGSTIDYVLGQRPAEVPIEVVRLAVMELIRIRVMDSSIERIPLTPNSVLRAGSRFHLS